VKLTPLDIRRQEFKRVVRGVDPEEVSVFLDMVAGEYERLLRENKALTEERDELKRKVEELDSMRDAIQDAVVMAKKSSDELLKQAQREAELRLKEAEVEAERIVGDARRRVADFKREIDEIKNQRAILLGRMRSLLEGQMKMLEAYAGDWEEEERGAAALTGTARAPRGDEPEQTRSPETLHPGPVAAEEGDSAAGRRRRGFGGWPEGVRREGEPAAGTFLREPDIGAHGSDLEGGELNGRPGPEAERLRAKRSVPGFGRVPDEEG